MVECPLKKILIQCNSCMETGQKEILVCSGQMALKTVNALVSMSNHTYQELLLLNNKTSCLDTRYANQTTDWHLEH